MPDKQIESGVAGVPAIDVEILASGDGTQKPKAGDTVSMHYVGTFKDGTKFDSSRDRGSPFQFALGAGMVIQGWDLVGAEMSVGDKWSVTIPYQLAYGEAGYPGAIPPKSDLVFEMELMGFA